MTNELDATLVSRLADGLVGDDFAPVAALFGDSGVAPPTVTWTPGVGELGSKPLDFLIEHWTSRKAERPWPDADAIDPVDLRPALGGLLVCEPTDNNDDFRIRLYGSKLALDMGRDLTGTFISDFEPGSYITTFYLACYRAVVLRGRPLFTRHTPSTRAYAADIKRLLLPFGSDGAVTRILTGVDSVPRRPLAHPNWTRR